LNQSLIVINDLWPNALSVASNIVEFPCN